MLKLSFCQNCLSIVSDPTRGRILSFLAQKSPQTVGEIVAQFKLRQPTISHHLALLKKENFVTAKKKGNEVYYSINLNCHKNPKTNCFLLQPSTQLPL